MTTKAMSTTTKTTTEAGRATRWLVLASLGAFLGLTVAIGADTSVSSPPPQASVAVTSADRSTSRPALTTQPRSVPRLPHARTRVS